MSSERREHPAAILHEALSGLRDIVVPVLVAVLITGNLGTAPLFGLLAVGLSAATGYARWNARRFWIDEGALHQRSGVFTPDVTTIPLARITAVDETQGLAQRVADVVAVDVQTAGGGASGEIVIQALTREDAEALRRSLGHAARPDELAAPERPVGPERAQEPDWRMTPRDLVLTAVTTPQTGLVVSLLGFLGLVASELAEESDPEDVLDALPDDPAVWIAIGAGALVVALVLALAGAVVAYGGFQVTREPDRLRIRRGLVERRAASVLVARVHAIRIDRSPLRRLLGLCRVRLDVAGYAAEPAVAQTLVPICRRAEVEDLLDRLLPELPFPDAAPLRPPARSLTAYAVGPAAAAAAVLALGAGIAVALGAPPAVWTAVGAGAVLVLAHGTARRHAAACRVDATTTAMTGLRGLTLSTTVALVRRLQSRERRQTLLQHRRDLATVSVGIGSGRTETVRHLDETEATGAFAALDPLAAAGRREV